MSESGSDGRRAGKLLHRELSYGVIGCAQKVHAAIGPGLPEKVYHRALCLALGNAGLGFVSEAAFQVKYEGQACGSFKADLVVDNKIILELKAAESLCSVHEAQVLAYLKASGLRVALLMNFGEKSLVWKRFVK